MFSAVLNLQEKETYSNLTSFKYVYKNKQIFTYSNLLSFSNKIQPTLTVDLDYLHLLIQSLPGHL